MTSAARRGFASGSGSSSRAPPLEDLCDALDVNKTTEKWTVLVQVLERHPPKDSKENVRRRSYRYRNYVVVDMKGTKVNVATYDANIMLFDNTLLPYRRYYISNAGVRDSEEQYRLSSYEYSWTLYKSTPVDPYEEASVPRFPCTYELTKFSDFYSHADRGDPITIMAFVVQSLDEKHHHELLKSRDYILISQEKLPVVFRVWYNPIEQYNIELAQIRPDPVLIILRNAKVTTHHGLSLSTRSDTYVLEDPPLTDEDMWTEWYEANHREITDIVCRRVYYDTARMFRPPTPNEIIPIETAITTMNTLKTAWIRGHLNIVPAQGKLWSTGYCNRNYATGSNKTVFCATCKERTPVELKAHIGVHIGDESGTMDVILSSPELEKIIPFSPIDIKAADENRHPLHDEIEEIIGNKEVDCFIKYYDSEFRGIIIRRHPVLKLYTDAEMIQPTPASPPALLESEEPKTPVSPTTETDPASTVEIPEGNITSTTPPAADITASRILPQYVTEKAQHDVQITSGTKRSLRFSLANIKKEKGEAAASATSEPKSKVRLISPHKPDTTKQATD